VERNILYRGRFIKDVFEKLGVCCIEDVCSLKIGEKKNIYESMKMEDEKEQRVEAEDVLVKEIILRKDRKGIEES